VESWGREEEVERERRKLEEGRGKREDESWLPVVLKVKTKKVFEG
jgi:hypothetical protein